MQGLPKLAQYLLVAMGLVSGWYLCTITNVAVQPSVLHVEEERANESSLNHQISHLQVKHVPQEGAAKAITDNSVTIQKSASSALTPYEIMLDGITQHAVCEAMQRDRVAGVPSLAKRQFVERGVSNGANLWLENIEEQSWAECQKYFDADTYRPSYDAAMDLFLAGDDVGLYLLASSALPPDFAGYDAEKQAEYRESIGRLIEQRLSGCDAAALGFYSTGIGFGVGWTLDEKNLSEAAINYKRRQILDIYERLHESPIVSPSVNDDVETQLSWSELKRIQSDIEQIISACNQAK